LGANGACSDSGIPLLAVTNAAASPAIFTNKTLDAEGIGNSISFPTKAFFAAAGCANSVAASNWDVGTTNVPNAICQGTNSIKGVLQFARGNVAYINFELPSDWNPTSRVDLKIAFTTAGPTPGQVTAWDIATGCNSIDGTMTDDPLLTVALPPASLLVGAVSNAEYAVVQTGLPVTSCRPGYNLVIQITRDSTVDTNSDPGVAAKWAELTFGRTVNNTNR
jgi:hypothetical protein